MTIIRSISIETVESNTGRDRYKVRLYGLETQLTALGGPTPEAIEKLPGDKVDQQSRASSEAKVGRYSIRCGGQVYQLHCPLREEP
jgi:hypothetical protein